MSEKKNISTVADAFFRLWQKQVSLMAQSPETAFEQLKADGKQIREHLKDNEDVSGKKKTP